VKKSIKKGLTKEERCGILCRLSRESERRREKEEAPRKKLEKSLKKLLTKASECDIINRLSTRAAKKHKAH